MVRFCRPEYVEAMLRQLSGAYATVWTLCKAPITAAQRHHSRGCKRSWQRWQNMEEMPLPSAIVDPGNKGCP